MSVSFLNDRLHFVLAIQPSKNVGRNKTTQAQRVVAFPAFRALQMPETLYSLTLIKSYSGLQLSWRGIFKRALNVGEFLE